jgi:hypothetical protein
MRGGKTPEKTDYEKNEKNDAEFWVIQDHTPPRCYFLGEDKPEAIPCTYSA